LVFAGLQLRGKIRKKEKERIEEMDVSRRVKTMRKE